MITMYSFIEDYKNGAPLGISLDSFIKVNPNHQLALAMKKVHIAIADINYFDDAVSTTNQINYNDFAVEEQLIFLEVLCYLYLLANRANSATSVLSTIKRLASNELPTEWKTIPLVSESIFYYFEGNCQKKIELFEQCLQMLGPKSGRYKLFLWTYLLDLCSMNENEKFEVNLEIYKSQIKGTIYTHRADYLSLMRNIEIGNFKKLPHLISKVKDDNSMLIFAQQDIANSQKLYEIFIENNYDFLKEEKPEDWLFLSCAHLLRCDAKKSLFWAHKVADKKIDSKMMPSFINYFLIRAELANKNTNNAEYYLENRRKSTNSSIYDNYFWFRLFHIKGDRNNAQRHFNLFLANVEKYKLDSRFDIELKLSPEISSTDIRFYTRNLDKPIVPNQIPIILPEKTNDENNLNFIIGESKAINQVKLLIQKYSLIDTTVLIVGETGTGKELVAKALWKSSYYKDKPYIPINCGAISDHLLQSELFGHKKGAFTGAFQDHKGVFEEAGDGVVFLDEIGEISPTMQVNLLRILEAKEFRPVGSNETKLLKCKIIAATNRDLSELVKVGSYRQDLQYRLERLTIEIPPLRDRVSDIPILINHFLNVENPLLSNIHFDKAAMQHIATLPWQGNIRELRNEMERIRLFYSDNKILTIAELSNKYKPKEQLKISDLKSNKTAPAYSFINAKSKFRKIEELKSLFRQHPRLSRVEVADFLKISSNTAGTYLIILEKENFVKKINLPYTKSLYFEIIS